MSEIYIFSPDDELHTIISESTGLTSASFRDEVNSVPSEPLIFTVDADEERAKYIKEENRVVFQDKDGFFREMVIKEIDDVNDVDGVQTQATCLPAWLDELSENFVLDKRYTDKEAQLALDDALVGTRYIGEVEVSLGIASTNFYRISSVDCIWKILEVWGGEFKDVVEFTGNKITTRKIIIKKRLGADNGARFESDHNIEEIQRIVLSYPKTAMYGYGASLETEGGGNTRYIDFGNVVWSKDKGDPTDKPLGQTWVGDPDALLQYGRKYDGQLLHRFAEFSNQDYENPEDLLWATWLNLQVNKEPVVNYKLSVNLLDKDVSLGDGAVAIDREFSRPIEIQARVIAMEYDLLDIEGTMIVEMGQFLNLDDDRLDDVINEIEKIRNRPSKVTEDSFPNRKPSRPINVEAHGGREIIQLYWDYADELFIKHYEVYGSQVADFVPDTQHLLWRGQVSAFAHAVNTDETWYYYVRAVNYHGTPSDWSARVSASTTRIISDDILFGEDLAERLRELNRVSDIIGENGVDFNQISEEAKHLLNQEARIYTDEEIRAVRSELNTKFEEYGNHFINIDTAIDDINGSLSTKVERGIFDEFTETVEYDMAQVNLRYDEISTTVSNIQIGGRNYFVVSEALENRNIAWATGNTGSNEPGSLASGFIPVELGATYSISPSPTSQLFYYNADKQYISDFPNMSGGSEITIPNDVRIAYMRVTFRNNFLNGRTKEEAKVKIEKGNIATDWTPAPEDIDQRMTVAESSITQLADDITLKVDVDNIVSEINLNREGIRLSSELIHLSGLSLIDEAVIQTAYIADGAITRVKLGTAVIGTAQIEDAAITNAKIASVNADKINAADLQAISGNMGTLRSGRLLSNNNNMDLNLNTGSLRMSNVDFTLGGGANIVFEDAGNKIKYTRFDSEQLFNRTSGFGVGNVIGGRYPFAYVGTDTGTNLDTLSVDFTGLQVFTAGQINTGAATNISSHRFELRNRANGWDRGLTFDWFGTPNITPMANSSHDLGTPGLRFRRLHVNEIRGSGNVQIRDAYGSGGWQISTDWSSGENLYIGGLNTGSYNYNIGRSTNYLTYAYVNSVHANYLRGELQGSSARKFKKNEGEMLLEDSLEFIRNAEIVTFDWIRDESQKFNIDNPQTLYDRQVGFILDDLKMENDYLVKSAEDTIKKDNIIFMHQQVIQNNLTRLDSHEDEINWLKTENQLQANEIKILKNKVQQLEEKVA